MSAALAAGVGVAAISVAVPARAADAGPDFAFFKERIEPVLQSVCAQCHAGKGKGAFGLVVHAAGAPFPDADHRTNFDTVVKLLVPGKPDQSKFLLKPLAEKDGGVKHGGNDRIFRGTPAYKAWADFINGEKGTAAPAATPGSPPGQPDFGFFLAGVEPVLLGVCAQCHAGAGKGQFALVTHTGGTRFPLADHRKNFDGVVRLLVPGKPEQSKFLLKPLAERDGGVRHQGGDRIAKADANYKTWVDFINGVKGPPVPEEAPPEPELPTVLDKGLVLQAEDMKIVGDASAVPLGDGSGKVVAPGAAGGRLTAGFRAGRPGEYALTFRVGPGVRPLRMRVDGGEFMEIESPKDGAADVGPRLVLDGGKPVDGRAGKLTVEGDSIRMDGREGMARFLAAADLAHTKVDAKVSVPVGDDPGRDDAWLLFDCANEDGGKFFGLADAGRKVVMGVLEEGRPRVIKSVSRPAGPEQADVRLSVEFQPGVAVGRLDGKPILFINFDRGLQAGRFGFLTHGVMTVRECVATHGAEEVHRMKPSIGGVLHLRRANHSLEVDLLPGCGALDAVTIKELPR